MNKHIMLRISAMILAFATLAACGKKADSSSASGSAETASATSSTSATSDTSATSGTSASGSDKASSGSKAKAVSGSAQSQSSAAASQSGSTSVSAAQAAAQAAPDEWPLSFATIIPKNEKLAQLLELHAPNEWAFDGCDVFTVDNVKTCELISMQKASRDAPYPVELMTKYNAKPAAEGENGLIAKEDAVYGDNKCKTYVYRAMPTDAQTEYNVYFCLLNLGNYTLETAFYSQDITSAELPSNVVDVLTTAKLTDFDNLKA